MGQKALGAEPAEYRSSGEGGKVPQRLDAQAYQQVGESGHVSGVREPAQGTEVGTGQHPDRPGGQEGGAASLGHNQRLPSRRQPRRQTRRKKPVGDAHPAATAPAPHFPGPKSEHPGHYSFDRSGDLGRQGRIPPEIA